MDGKNRKRKKCCIKFGNRNQSFNRFIKKY